MCDFYRAVLEPNLLDNDDFLYEDAPELQRFCTATPSIELLTDWYQSRAQDIDACSRQVWTLSLAFPASSKKRVDLLKCQTLEGDWDVFVIFLTI